MKAISNDHCGATGSQGKNLRQILALGHESEIVNYKSTCDISQNDEHLEIIKDIAALQIRGGCIVVGADDNGPPTGGVDSHYERLFEHASYEQAQKMLT